MTTEEFSNAFDTLLNSYSTIVPFGGEARLDITVDEYEKSLFLTKAQEETVTELYTGKNSSREGFEKTEELRRYLSDLVTTKIITERIDNIIGLSDNSTFFKLPNDVMFITNESVKLEDTNLKCNIENVIVVPVRQDDYHSIIKNPFRGPSNKRVLRLDIKNNIVELVSKYNISKYIVRYLAKPTPIILTDLGDLTIEGVNTITECRLNSALHKYILDRAVRLAILSKTQVTNNKV